MILLRSRLGDDVDDSAQRAAEGSVIVVGLNLEFLDVVENRRDGVGAAEGPLIVHAVQQEKVAAVGLPVDRGIAERPDRVRPHTSETAILRNVDGAYARSQIQQLSEVPSVQWEVVHLLSYDGYAQFGSGCFQRGDGRLHRHCLLYGAGIQRVVNGRSLIHIDGDV